MIVDADAFWHLSERQFNIFLNSQNQNAGVTVQGLTRIAIPEKLPKVDLNINPDESKPPELSEKNKISFIKR